MPSRSLVVSRETPEWLYEADMKSRQNFEDCSFEPVPIVITTTNPAKKQRMFSRTGCLNINEGKLSGILSILMLITKLNVSDMGQK